MVIYEELLDNDLGLALKEGSMHFEKESAVHKTLRRLAQRLEALDIPYVLVGGMALFLHGYRRFTEDVDILVTPDGLHKIHQQLEGLGYVALFDGSKSLRDTETGVRIEFLVSGQFPGDGKPKPVCFPSPQQVGSEMEGIRCINLRSLVELKLASGMAPGRRKDLADVQELIKILHVPAEWAQQLNPFVRDLFGQIWSETQKTPQSDGARKD
ncbi:MAG: nucleotidyltransferase family protein [Planctomycetes bacterium]|nr:nucleotidyltransferase family protein [Planctomycetota bacterium]